MKHIANYTKLFIILGLFAFIAGCNGAGNKNSVSNNRPANNANTSQVPTNAPIGAQPPNMLGSPTAAVTVEEFADFQCPTCASVHGIMKNVQSLYGSRIKFVYRNYPLSQIHKNSYEASLAAESAGAQGKFWDMQNQLFTNQQAWSNSSDARAVFEGYAEKIGLDVEKFKSDVVALGTKSRVDADLARGRALNISSTPTIFINGKSVPFEQMNLDALKGLIDAELQKAGTQTQTAPPPANTTTNTTTTSVANTTKANANK